MLLERNESAESTLSLRGVSADTATDSVSSFKNDLKNYNARANGQKRLRHGRTLITGSHNA